MKSFEIFNGTSEDATLIGRVVARDEIEAISTLQAYRNGFKVTEPGVAVPQAYVEWAHEKLEQIHVANVPFWRARAIVE